MNFCNTVAADMHDYLLSAISFLCILLAGLHAEECSQEVLAKRNMLYVLEGGSQTLSCVIRHCGHNWIGNWMWKNSTDKTFSVVQVSDRHHLMKEEVSAIETRLVLKLVRISPLDEGFYGCSLVWGQGNVDTGHLTYLNVTAGLNAEECRQGVLAKRNIFHVLEGGSQNLSCVILHCGHNWTGNWMWKNSTDETLRIVEVSDRHHLMKEELSANETRLVLKLVRISPLDEGSYRCRLVWGQGNMDMGHLTDLNVTAVTQRNWWHIRVLVCAPALVCFPLLLVLVYCLHPSTQLTHVAVYCAKVPHKSCNSSLKAFPKLQEKTEVVYTAISKEGLRRVAALQATASNSRT